MKKWIAFMLVFVLAFVFVGCQNPDDNTDDEIKVEKVTISGLTDNTITVGDEVQLSAKVEPNTVVNKKVNWLSKNTNIITVDSTGKIKGIAPGTATVVASAEADPKKQAQVTVTVEEEVVILPPESVTISGSSTVTVESNIPLTATVAPNPGAAQEVTWSSSDTSIATVDENGKVSGVKVGNVTITATTVAEPKKSATHDVEVKAKFVPPTEKDNPIAVVVNGEKEVYEGRFVYLQATVKPSGASQNVTWTSDNPEVATVDEQGTVIGVKQGTAKITATVTATGFEHIKYTLPVIVSAKPVITIPNLQAYKIVLMSDQVQIKEHNPNDPNYTGNDQQARKDAWDYVQTNFNCQLAVEAYPQEANWGPNRQNWLIDQVTKNTVKADFFVLTTDWVKTLVDGGVLLPTTTYYETYGQNTITNFLKTASTYKSQLYAVPTNNYGSIHVDKGLFYNVNLLNSLGLESPAKLFMNDEWSYSDFKDYVLTASEALQEGQTVLSGMPAQFYFGMVNAAGVPLGDVANLTFNFDNKYARQVVQMLREIHEAAPNIWGTKEWDEKVTSFQDGLSIFQAAEYWFVRDPMRFEPEIWGPGSKFGYVPYPYPDTMSNSDTRTINAGSTCFMMAKGREALLPTGVTSENVYQAFTTLQIKTMDNLFDSGVDEETLMRKSAEKKLDDSYSIEAVLFFKRNKVIFDPAYGMHPIYAGAYLGPALTRVVQDGNDYDSEIATLLNLYETRMMELFG